MNSSATVTGCDHIERLLDMVAAPTPPVMLPPLPHPLTNIIDGDDWSDVFTADQMHDYARAALAQYGIKEQSDE